MNGPERNRQLNGGAPPGWSAVLPRVIDAPRSGDAKPTIYAIISTWFDEDIIAANIANCIANGASRVFVLDNGSPDRTAYVAKAAGAEQVEVYHTNFYDDDLRIRLQNELIRTVTESSGVDDLWWMVLDSDEFPTTHTGRPVWEFLAGMPDAIRIVGSDCIDLYPTGENQYRPGSHPAACMPMGMWRRGGLKKYCECGHWKHAIIRLRGGVRDIAHNRGNHAVTMQLSGRTGAAISAKRVAVDELCEPSDDLVMFHAPIRSREHMHARLQALCDTGRNRIDDQVTGGNGAIKRRRSLDDIYAGRWRDVEIPHTQKYGRPVKGVALYPWRRLLFDFAGELK